jgi:hypothetical protein
MPLHFEDLPEGQRFLTPGRTGAEPDVVSFAAPESGQVYWYEQSTVLRI